MRKFCSFLIGCLTFLSLSAQTPLSQQEAQQVLSQISAAAQQTKTLQAQFVQTKTLKMLNHRLVSRGRMAYAQPTQLRWEYSTPTHYVFVLSGNKVLLGGDRGKNVVDVRQNKVFQQIARLMVSNVTGQCLTDRSFRTQLFSHNGTWIAQLTPQRGEMKALFSQITLTIDPKLAVVSRVVLTERSGDVTTIELSGFKKNQHVAASDFKVD